MLMQGIRLAAKGVQVNAHAERGQPVQAIEAAAQQLDRAGPFALFDLMQRHANLQDALVQFTHRTRFLTPGAFQQFVLFPVMSRVERLEAGHGQRGRRIVPAFDLLRYLLQMLPDQRRQLLHEARPGPGMVAAGLPRRGQRPAFHVTAEGHDGDQARVR